MVPRHHSWLQQLAEVELGTAKTPMANKLHHLHSPCSRLELGTAGILHDSECQGAEAWAGTRSRFGPSERLHHISNNRNIHGTNKCRLKISIRITPGAEEGKTDWKGFGQMGMFDAQIVVNRAEDVVAVDELELRNSKSGVH
jgi:hypothetical protein